MLVILRESISNLGQTGDVVKVSDGYARNFLIPRNMVSPADDSNLKTLNHNKRILDKKRSKEKASAEELSSRLANHSCTVSRKVGENDRLFGSVTAADIAKELEKGGFNIDRRTIQIDDPIKTLGVHPVEIKLQPDVTATVKVWVVKEE